MPLLEIIKHDFNSQIAIWKFKETIKEMFEVVKLSVIDKNKMDRLSNKKKVEFLTKKACLLALNIDLPILYNSKGKPFLANNQFISISHSHQMTCVAISKRPIGVDIEFFNSKKVENIQSKFIKEEEKIWIDKKENKTKYLQIIWGIKESLYKICGGEYWNFLNHYMVNKFNLEENKSINCYIVTDEKSIEYIAYCKKIEDYILVYSLNMDL